MSNAITTWPPIYNLRISKKAKRVYIKIFPHRGLEIVVPVRQQARFIVADLLAEKKSWIEKHLANVMPKPLERISKLSLLAIKQHWQIVYIPTNSQQIRHIIAPGTDSNVLTLYGNVQDIQRTNLWLKQWLKKLAQQHLCPWLQKLSTQHKLVFNKSAIRAQQTLWGSCTAQKNISLNYKIVFIPPQYAEHIMLHELCHTKYLDHSKRFWDLLTSLDPETERHNRAIRTGDQFVPLAFT